MYGAIKDGHRRSGRPKGEHASAINRLTSIRRYGAGLFLSLLAAFLIVGHCNVLPAVPSHGRRAGRAVMTRRIEQRQNASHLREIARRQAIALSGCGRFEPGCESTGAGARTR